MKQLASALGLLNLVHKQNLVSDSNDKSLETNQSDSIQAEPAVPIKHELDKEELRLLVKMLKAIGHTCEHKRISIQNNITHYLLGKTTLIFDGVNHKDSPSTLHLSPLSDMQTNPDLKRPTWEKLKTLKP